MGDVSDFFDDPVESVKKAGRSVKKRAKRVWGETKKHAKALADPLDLFPNAPFWDPGKSELALDLVTLGQADWSDRDKVERGLEEYGPVAFDALTFGAYGRKKELEFQKSVADREEERFRQLQRQGEIQRDTADRRRALVNQRRRRRRRSLATGGGYGQAGGSLVGAGGGGVGYTGAPGQRRTVG